MAFFTMESVRKGKWAKGKEKDQAAQEAAMREANVEEWFIDSCKKIKYMFPKAHAAAYVISAIRLGWFKVYKPLEFYCAYFSAAPDGFDAEIAMSGRTNIIKVIDDLEAKVLTLLKRKTDF